MSDHKPDYDEIRRLEKELFGFTTEPEPEPEQKPTPPPSPGPPPPRTKHRIEPGAVWHVADHQFVQFAASATTSGMPVARAYFSPRKTVTIYDHRGKPLYDTPAA